MAQTASGAIKIAAQRIGISEREYREHLVKGEKWCMTCHSWHLRQAFGVDRSRGDGLASACKEAKNKTHRSEYSPRPRPLPGRVFVPFRSGDKKQARSRINHLVNIGLLPDPNTIQCCDCAHLGGGRRHEYDHYLGYSAEHHEHVQVVCSRCHHRRAWERGEVRRGNIHG